MDVLSTTGGRRGATHVWGPSSAAPVLQHSMLTPVDTTASAGKLADEATRLVNAQLATMHHAAHGCGAPVGETALSSRAGDVSTVSISLRLTHVGRRGAARLPHAAAWQTPLTLLHRCHAHTCSPANCLHHVAAAAAAAAERARGRTADCSQRQRQHSACVLRGRGHWHVWPSRRGGQPALPVPCMWHANGRGALRDAPALLQPAAC
jgi:hypothetical protein